jgi:hypothetical protein
MASQTRGVKQREVPLGRWAEYVCAYLEGGSPRLMQLSLAGGDRTGSFALAVLKAVRTIESVQSVLSLTRAAGQAENRALAIGCADALNDLLVFKPQVAIDPALASEARGFLHRLLATKLATPDLALVYGALRAVGDASTLELIEGGAPPAPPWEELQAIVIRAIRQRLRR